MLGARRVTPCALLRMSKATCSDASQALRFDRVALWAVRISPRVWANETQAIVNGRKCFHPMVVQFVEFGREQISSSKGGGSKG